MSVSLTWTTYRAGSAYTFLSAAIHALIVYRETGNTSGYLVSLTNQLAVLNINALSYNDSSDNFSIIHTSGYTYLLKYTFTDGQEVRSNYFHMVVTS